jgi:hypothetical protein
MRLVSHSRFGWAFGVAAAALFAASASFAAEPIQFGPFDVPTVFAIAKSDNRNQVEYGARLDRHCDLIGKAPIFGYWREFESNEKLHGFSWLDGFAYSITNKPASNRDIEITSKRDEKGQCQVEAHAVIAKQWVKLQVIFVQLNSPLSVKWVELRGLNSENQPVVERVTL